MCICTNAEKVCRTFGFFIEHHFYFFGRISTLFGRWHSSKSICSKVLWLRYMFSYWFLGKLQTFQTKQLGIKPTESSLLIFLEDNYLGKYYAKDGIELADFTFKMIFLPMCLLLLAINCRRE